MIRKDKHKFADGSYKTQIRVTEGYRDPVTGKPKQKTIKSFGYLEDNENQEAFMQMVKDFDIQFKKNKKIVLNETPTKPFYEDNTSDVFNFGYRFLEVIYDSLGIDNVLNSIEYKGKHKLSDMFKFLVLERILNPDSKRATYQRINNFYSKNFDFSLHELYRSLDYFSYYSNAIQKAINESVESSIGRNTLEVFFDSTNYYFQKDYQDEDTYVEVTPRITDKKIIKKRNLIDIVDENGELHQFEVIPGLSKRGVSKEHVVDPIVQLGLLMDGNGIPINMQLFPGNTSDSKTMLPILSEVKKAYNLNKIVVVADKGMNCSENIDVICNNKDGYMFSQILKGKKGKRYEDRLFDESKYIVVNKDYKYQIFEEEYVGKDISGNKVIRKRKVLIYWNGKTARREQRKREEKVNKAKKSLINKAYTINHGYTKYLNESNIVSTTGECADYKVIDINHDKIKEEEKYDGYFAIVTSELDYDEKKIREVYHGLWRIEESFRITKSELTARPIFVRTKEHINSHFLICYVALTIIRILQQKMNYSLSVERIIRALNMCSCSNLSKGIVHVIKKDTLEQYSRIKTKDGKKYYSLDIEKMKKETVEDFKEILKYYSAGFCASMMNKSEFDKFLKTIKLK